MAESAADRLAYLTEFGETVEFHLAAVNWEAPGVFDQEFVEVQGVEARRPVILCRTDDAYDPDEAQSGVNRALNRATSLQIPDGGFDIVAVEEDGAGMSQLVLERQ